MTGHFITHYIEDRLHQALDFVTPAERHDGRHTAIIYEEIESGKPISARTDD